MTIYDDRPCSGGGQPREGAALSGSTTYSYCVKAYNQGGESACSNTVEATVSCGSITPPGPESASPTLVSGVVDGAATQAGILSTLPNGETHRSYYSFNGQRVAMRQVDAGGERVLYLLGDHLGSTSLVVDASGNKVAEARYYPYGQERWSSGTLPTEYRFTGQRQLAGLGLYQMGARFYDPYIARWLSADTLVPEPGKPQALNRYSYVEGNPLRYWDPTGHSKFEDWLTEVGIKVGNSGALGKALMVSGSQVVNHLNGQRQDIFFPDENTTALDRLGACTEIGGGSVVFAAAVTEAFAGTLTTAAMTGGTAEVATTTGTVTTAASANGDPTDEARAIQTGINTVYRSVQEGVTRYVGITNDFARRAAEHQQQRGLQIQPILGLEQLGRSDARAVEQVLIEHYELPNLLNRINSVAVTNPIYQEAIQRGTEILRQIGFFAE